MGSLQPAVPNQAMQRWVEIKVKAWHSSNTQENEQGDGDVCRGGNICLFYAIVTKACALIEKFAWKSFTYLNMAINRTQKRS